MTEPAPRCALAARARGDLLAASASPARRFLLLEVAGPWPTRDALAGALPGVAAALSARAAPSGVRILLIRRPERHPRMPGAAARWYLLDRNGCGREGVWSEPDELLDVDLAAALPPWAGRPLALVCTHGRHDRCCAVDGRPVAAAVAAAGLPVDTWECSHLGGDRFAANLLVLPVAWLFGSLHPGVAPGVVASALDGRVDVARYRGRCGDPHAWQVAQWHALRYFGEDRPDSIAVDRVEATPDGLRVVARHLAARSRHRRPVALTLRQRSGPPALLTCSAAEPRPPRWYELTAVQPGAAVQPGV